MCIARFVLAGILAVGMSAIQVPSQAQVAVGISVRIGPPVLPIYTQPICPGPDYIWIPGYWAYGDDGYYWVPGTWVEPPEVGLLWTPGYWAWDDGFYIWHAGYWGPEVGFYGGIDYGFGYPGAGYYGGYWRGGQFFYNRAVTNVNVEVIHNTYETRVVNNNTTFTRASFNGGPEGTRARPTTVELNAQRERHVSMTSAQLQQQETARSNRTMLASVNHGRPDIAATQRPGQFSGRNAVTTGQRGNPNLPPANSREANREVNRGRNSDRPPTLFPNDTSVNPPMTARQQQETQKMQRKQDAERQKMEQQQTREQQKLVQQRANEQRQQQLQQRQQQQREQLQRKHDEQSQKLQQRQQRETQQRAKPPKPGKPHDQ